MVARRWRSAAPARGAEAGEVAAEQAAGLDAGDERVGSFSVSARSGQVRTGVGTEHRAVPGLQLVHQARWTISLVDHGRPGSL